MLSGGPLLDNPIRVVAIVAALLARRLIEFFLSIGIRFGFGSFDIWLGMAGPVIATDFLRRREAGLRRGSPASSSSSESRRGISNRGKQEIKTRIKELKQFVFQSSERVLS